jgi:cytochrome c oxidase cbb3-type subunit 3
MKKLNKLPLAFLLIALCSSVLFAQDGQALFKSKCNTCHLLDKASTGPMLKGVKQKWTDAGEGEMLFDWVTNSGALIGSGKSKMANEIKGFSPMEMPGQQVTKEELDAILTFVDNPPVSTAAPATGDVVTDAPAEEVVYKPNYKENLVTFYWLIASIVILLIVIFILSSSIINLVKSDYFTNKIAEKKQKEGSNVIQILAVIITFGAILFGNSAMAMSIPEPSTEPQPWVLVENADLYFLITINVVLVLVIIYLQSQFKRLLGMVYERKQKEKEVKTIKKLNQVLTDVVPIEEEHTILLHHEYDGIRELDNNLPPWWVWGFFTTIVVAIIYLFHYHVFKTGDLQITAYEKEMKKSEYEVKAYLSKMAMNVDETNATLMTSPEDVNKGKALFETNCVTCHNPKGEGNIGPNLTDKTWIYGYDIKDVFKTVKNGTPNGMPEHNSKFNPIQIQQVASFILSLPEAKGKAPQGDIME